MKKSDNGTVTYYLRSTVLGGQVVAEMNGTGGWTRGYVYLGSQLLAVQQAGVYWMHEDPVTKSKRVTNSVGAVVSTIELDPWGADTPRSNNVAFQPKKFTSYDRDENGTDEAMFRRYNRWQSRFDQPDPYDGSYDATDPQSFNRYAYVQGDPVNFVDPSGLKPILTCPPDSDGVIRVCTWAPSWDGFTAFLFYIFLGQGGGTGRIGEPGGGGDLGPQDTGGHEFAHARRALCPPTGQSLAANPTVKATIKEASQKADEFRDIHGYWIEHGGWIFANLRTGRVATYIKEPATSPPFQKDYPYLDYHEGNSPKSMSTLR